MRGGILEVILALVLGGAIFGLIVFYMAKSTQQISPIPSGTHMRTSSDEPGMVTITVEENLQHLGGGVWRDRISGNEIKGTLLPSGSFVNEGK